MNETEQELWKALDNFVFGSNDPRVRQEKLFEMEGELARERSSLGRFLQSLRVQEELSTKQVSHLCRVDLELWKKWEMDFATPSRDELESIVKTMRWRSYIRGILWELWDEAARFRLKRLTSFRGEALAARGVTSESGIAWLSAGEENQKKLLSWGRKNDCQMPDDLPDILSALTTEEEREAWVQQVLGEPE